MVIGFILFISPAYRSEWSAYTIWWIVFIALYLTSFFHVMAFVNPNSLQKSKSNEPGYLKDVQLAVTSSPDTLISCSNSQEDDCNRVSVSEEFV